MTASPVLEPGLGELVAAQPSDSVAVVIGASGGIGSALVLALLGGGEYRTVVALSRQSDPPIDIEAEATIAAAAEHVGALGTVRLIVDATGLLHGSGVDPEKSWRQLDAARLARYFAINAIGPALLMKYFLPLLPRSGPAVFATLSAKVGSIADNELGGWYGYRASKAALNQFVRTAAIELRRSRPDAICVAIHPGTVDTGLSAPFAKAGLAVHAPDDAAHRILRCLKGLTPPNSGGFFDRNGDRLPW